VSACCSTYANVAGAYFDEKTARRDLESYRKKGAGPTARLLRDMLVDTGAVDGVLLDVGSGVGGLSFDLLERGVTRAIAVDASAAYLAAAAQEATRRDRLGAVEFKHGDFLDVGSMIPPATIVTMDRVIRCYPAFEALLKEALGTRRALLRVLLSEGSVVRPQRYCGRERRSQVQAKPVPGVRPSGCPNDADHRTCGVSPGSTSPVVAVVRRGMGSLSTEAP
jgi:SAM-dependent methyltransferase